MKARRPILSGVGIDLGLVADITGHESVETTALYASDEND